MGRDYDSSKVNEVLEALEAAGTEEGKLAIELAAIEETAKPLDPLEVGDGDG